MRFQETILEDAIFCFFSLEVHLTKAEPGTWNTLVIGDNRGKMVFTAEQMAEINEQLDKFTTDNEVILSSRCSLPSHEFCTRGQQVCSSCI
jgi:hypothetical protein